MATLETGLTIPQQQLLLDLIGTKTEAKVGRRSTSPNGSYYLYTHVRPTSPVDFPKCDEEFALKSHETDITAPLSPIYLNYRNLPLSLVNRMTQHMLERLPRGFRPDYFTGIPDAGTPFGKAASDLSGIHYIDIFAKAENDSGRQIVPSANARSVNDKTIAIFDDMITFADTKIEAAQAAEDLGYEVESFIVFTDRQQGGPEQLLATTGIRIYSAFRLLDDMIPLFEAQGRITPAVSKQVAEYITDNKAYEICPLSSARRESSHIRLIDEEAGHVLVFPQRRLYHHANGRN